MDEETRALEWLRRQADELPPGGSVTLTKDGLRHLLGTRSADAEEPDATAEMDTKAIAHAFGVHVQTVRDWASRGRAVPNSTVRVRLGGYRGARGFTSTAAELEAFRTEYRTVCERESESPSIPFDFDTAAGLK
jgi:hypothetical protein